MSRGWQIKTINQAGRHAGYSKERMLINVLKKHTSGIAKMRGKAQQTRVFFSQELFARSRISDQSVLYVVEK